MYLAEPSAQCLLVVVPIVTTPLVTSPFWIVPLIQLDTILTLHQSFLYADLRTETAYGLYSISCLQKYIAYWIFLVVPLFLLASTSTVPGSAICWLAAVSADCKGLSKLDKLHSFLVRRRTLVHRHSMLVIFLLGLSLASFSSIVYNCFRCAVADLVNLGQILPYLYKNVH